MTPPLSLDALDARFRSGRDRIHAACGGGVPDARRPSPEAWSPAEVVAHLNVIARADLPALERAVAAAPSGRTPEPLRLGLLGGLFVRSVAPGGRPFRTFRSMLPPQDGLDPAAVLAALDADTDRFLALVAAARTRDVSRARAASPLAPVLRLPVAAFLAGLAGHVHRHAAQIERGQALRA